MEKLPSTGLGMSDNDGTPGARPGHVPNPQTGVVAALTRSPAHIASQALSWCQRLGQISEVKGARSRSFGSAALERAARLVEAWMQGAGLRTRRDAFGNVIGRLAGADPRARTLVMGSHLDTVPDGGRYDGCLGVVLPIALCGALPPRALPFHIDVVAFLAEEGVRFGIGCLGSLAFAGALDPSVLDRTDGDGVPMADAVRVHGGVPERLGGPSIPPEGLLAFVETHIEQAPVLDRLGAPVGVVTGIVGQSRLQVTIDGDAGHAGTTPMDERRDALVVASELVVEVDRLARAQPGLVATVGRLDVAPNASNVIPGSVELSLDVRHRADARRAAAVSHLLAHVRACADRRGMGSRWRLDGERRAVMCDPGLSARLARAVADAGCPVHRLPSLAGHDAMVMAAVTPMAMLFVRSPGGLSHHPDEAIVPGDVVTAARVLAHVLDHQVHDHEPRAQARCTGRFHRAGVQARSAGEPASEPAAAQAQATAARAEPAGQSAQQTGESATVQ